MSNFSDVEVTLADGIQTVTFYHPKSNSLPAGTLAKLKDVFLEATQNKESKVILLQSVGEKAFCGGASFDELLRVDTPERGKEFFMGFARLMLAMRECPKFIITRVQGKVVGGGVGVVAASDYVLATSIASLKLSELALGIGPFVVGPVIERKIGHAAYMAMALDADWRDALWAREHGLYTHTFASSQEMDNALTLLLKKLTRTSEGAMRELKRVFWQGTETWEWLLVERAEISGRLVLSAESQRLIQVASRAG